MSRYCCVSCLGSDNGGPRAREARLAHEVPLVLVPGPQSFEDSMEACGLLLIVTFWSG